MPHQESEDFVLISISIFPIGTDPFVLYPVLRNLYLNSPCQPAYDAWGVQYWWLKILYFRLLLKDYQNH